MRPQPWPTYPDILAAHERIRPHIHRTPVLTSETVNRRLGAQVFFKCECFQKTGAYKFRGALNTILLLPPEAAARGVVTSSSGNQAQAVALAACIRGVPAYIAMPGSAPEVKKAAVAGYGAHICFCEWSLKALDDTADALVAETGATFIHPFNLATSIAGHATAALELLEDIPDLDVVMAPVGGGGLASGTALVAAALSPRTLVIAGEPELADDAYQSLQSGRIMPARPPVTIADGLRTSLGDLTFAILRQHLRAILTVSEEAIIEAMRFIWERMKIVIEPSAAVPVAALFARRAEVPGKRIGVILSGGNADLDRLPWTTRQQR